jgi:hypothetical protein
VEGGLTIRISVVTETEKGSRETEIVSLSGNVIETAKKSASVLQTTAIPSVSKLTENESANARRIGTGTAE